MKKFGKQTGKKQQTKGVKCAIINFNTFLSFGTALAVIACTVFLCRLAVKQKTVNAGTDAKNEFTVIIDAGHGGLDGGTQSADGTLEKDLNLAIASSLDSILRLYGYNTVMTRIDDNPFYESGASSVRAKKVSDTRNRMALIESYDNALFVSIHQNYFTQPKYSGSQVFYSGNNPESKTLAESIQNSIHSSLQKDNDRVIKKSGTEIFLLYHAQLPAVMVECGFLSNEAEAARLADSQYQKQIALAVANGIMNYIGTITEVKINGG